MNYYVYVYLDPRKPGIFKYNEYIFDFEPFYIGKGTRNRIRHHLVQRLKKKSFFYNKLNKIINDGFEPLFYKLIDGLTEEHSLLKEIELISLIGRKDIETGTLCNCSEGGEKGFSRSPETKEKLRQSKLGKKNPMFGKTTSDKQKSVVSELAKEKKGKKREELFSEQAIKNQLAGAKNRGKNKIKRKDSKIYEIISPSNISYLCKGMFEVQYKCSELNIQFQLLRKNLNKKIEENDIKSKILSAKNTIGWIIKQVNKSKECIS